MTGRHTSRSKDDRLYQATVDGDGLACREEVIPVAGYDHPVLVNKDDERRERDEGRGRM
jgi:hypothetical protein